MSKQSKKRKKHEDESISLDFDSIKFKTWLYFFLMALVTLALLWGAQLLFYKTYYKEMKLSDMEKVGDKLSLEYGRAPQISSPPMSFYIMSHEVAEINNADIYLFRHDKVRNIMEMRRINESIAGDNLENYTPIITAQQVEEFLSRSANTKDNAKGFVYLTDVSDSAYVVYGSKVEVGELNDTYVCMLSRFSINDSTTIILRNQLMIVTIIIILLSLMLSYFISIRISRPITQFSSVARKLGRGEYDVKFEAGNGFTEIKDLAETLNFATKEMSKTESLRRDFMANVSHDLRTPLTMVKAYAEMIRDISGKDEIKRVQHAQVIIDEADRLTALVADILDLSKLQSGTDNFDKGAVDMSMLTRTVLERFNIMSERDGYIFESDLKDGCVVMGDSKKLEQVLYNLIGNAINYTGADKRVSVKVKKGFCVTVEISDSGKGIEAEKIPQVWERYYRASEAKRKVVGSGIGLSIVKSILENHKAEFGIDSEVGVGTTFWFKLPLYHDKIDEQLS